MGHSTLLFGTPSFIEGFARSIDIAGVLTEFNASLSPRQSDSLATCSDWAAVGADLWTALSESQNELPEHSLESPKEEYAKAR